MNNEEFTKQALLLKEETAKESSIASMKLSAIIKKNFSVFEDIRINTQMNLKGANSKKSSYSKLIQDLLTKGGKFQKDGSPISEEQIISEMYRIRKLKGLVVDVPLPLNEMDNSFKSPTSDFQGSGGVKVSAKANKKVVALNNSVVEPKPIDNLAKATHIINNEIKAYKKDGVIPVWSSNDEWGLIDFKRQAGIEKVKLAQLATKGVLTPRFNQEIIDYFDAWLNKAYVCEKLFKD